MAEQQAPAAAQTLTQVNQEFAQARTNRLDAAISQALQSKLPPAPKGKGTASTAASRPGAPSTPSSAASTSAAPPPASSPAKASSAGAVDSTVTGGLNAALPGEPGSATPEPASADPGLAALALDGAVDDTADGGDGEALEGAAGAEEWAPDRDAVSAAATKKDLRALEKALGLEDGVLGSTNGEYAALRRREKEFESTVAERNTTHTKNQQQLINVFGPTVNLIEQAKTGNLMSYARTIEVTTGISIQAFVEHWAKNVHQMNPQALEMQRRLARYETPDGQPRQLPAAQEPAPAPAQGAPVTAEAATTKANTYITTEAKDHPALKLKGGLDEVRQVWLQSFDKATKTFKLTPQKAGDAVIAQRRQAHEQEQWILAGKQPPPARRRTTTIARTGASETQPRTQVKLTREQLIEKGAADMRRAKAADAARARR